MKKNVDKRNDLNYRYLKDTDTVTINAGLYNYLLDQAFASICNSQCEGRSMRGSCAKCPFATQFPNRNCTELTYDELVKVFKSDM